MGVLDYNAHINHDKARNKDGDIIFARKIRKQTKKWDVSAMLKKKIYIYFKSYETKSEWCASTCLLKTAITSPYDEPTGIQSTIGNTQLALTTEIVRTKESCFDKLI